MSLRRAHYSHHHDLYESGLTVATTYTLTGGTGSMAQIPFPKVKMWASLANGAAVINTTTHRAIFGSVLLTLDSNGDFEQELAATSSGQGYDPDGGFRWRIHVDARDEVGERKQFVSEPFEMTADATLDEVLAGTLGLTAVSAAEWADFQAKYDEIKDVVATTDGVMAAAIADPDSETAGALAIALALLAGGLASKSYSEHTVSGAVSIAADGTRALTLTNDTDLTLTGNNGDDVVLDVIYNGYTLAIDGVAFISGSPLAAVKSRGAWVITGGTTDTTGPTTPGSLAADPSTTSALLTWAASTDDVEVQGYEWRNGAGTWNDIGDVLTVNATGLTANTAYTFYVRAYDNAGNRSTAASVVTTTDVDPSAAYDIYDDFDAANGTAVVGRTTTKGSKVWAAAGGQTQGGGENNATITNNQVERASANLAAGITLASNHAETSIDYDMSTGSDSAANRATILYVAGNGTSGDVLSIHLRGDGSLACYKGGIVAVTLAGVTTGHATTGRLAVTHNAGALSISTAHGTATATVATGTGYSGTSLQTGFGAKGNATKLNNFGVKNL